MTTENIRQKRLLTQHKMPSWKRLKMFSNIIETTTVELDGHHEAFYQGAEFWVAMAFVLVVAALARPIGKTVVALLKKRIACIISRLEEASTLQEDAQKLLAEYEKKISRR